MPHFLIDLDTEAVQLDGRWYTRDELARKIKTALEAGDFAIGRASQALEHLTAQLRVSKTLCFKVTPEIAEALAQAALQQRTSTGAILRHGLMAALHALCDPPGIRRMERESLPAVGAPKIIVEQPSAEEAAGAVELLCRKKKNEEPELRSVTPASV